MTEHKSPAHPCVYRWSEVKAAKTEGRRPACRICGLTRDERDADAIIESEPTPDETTLLREIDVLKVKLEERSLELALQEANLHELRNPKHKVTVWYPYTCSCGWAGRVFPEARRR